MHNFFFCCFFFVFFLLTIGHYNTTIPKRQIVPDPKEMYFMMHGTFIEYSRDINEINFYWRNLSGRFQGKTSTLHFDINKLDYIEDAVYHLQTTGCLLHLCSTFNVVRGKHLESTQPPKPEVFLFPVAPSSHTLSCWE